MPPKLSLVELLEAAQKKATVGAFTDKLLQNFGGVEGFADTVHHDYFEAPEGSNQRAMIARSIIELMKANSPIDGEDLGERSPAELAAALTHIMGSATGA